MMLIVAAVVMSCYSFMIVFVGALMLLS